MQSFEVVIIGGGQAGLALGRCLLLTGLRFVILDANGRVGDSWRRRWDSLRLFTPASSSSLPGVPFPSADDHRPTKDEVADYLESYARRFGLPVRSGTRVASVERDGETYAVVTAGGQRIAAGQVVIATGAHHRAAPPPFAPQLDPGIVQLHSSRYRHPGQVPPGSVLVVGAGNSGAEIALDLARCGHRVILSGRDTGRVPTPVLRLMGLPLCRWIARSLLSADSPLGQRIRKKALRQRGAPLVGISRSLLRQAGVRLVPKIGGVDRGRPVLEGGEPLDVGAVVWATGYKPDYGFVRLLIFDAAGLPLHEGGQIPGVPGIYFLGLPFQSTPISHLLGGVGDDARGLSEAIVARAAALRILGEADTAVEGDRRRP